MSKIKIIHSILSLPWFLLFYLMICTPTVFQNIKIFLLAIALLEVTVVIFINNKGKINLTPVIVFFLLVYIILGTILTFVGYLHNSIICFDQFRVYVLWPILYVLFISIITKINHIKSIIYILVVSSFLIGLFSGLILLHEYGFISDFLFPKLFNRQDATILNGRIVAMHFKSIDSLMFLAPFVISSIIVWPSEKMGKSIKVLLFITAILLCIPTFFSARNALTVVVFISPIISVAILFLTNNENTNIKNKLKYILLFTIVFCIMAVLYKINFNQIINKIIANFDCANNLSAMIRREQLIALWNGFLDNPLIGAGFGSGVGLERSEKPWAYELSYALLLFHSGIIGFGFYFSGIFWIYYSAFKILKNNNNEIISLYLHPIIVGMTCFLIANSTNPYLMKFDYMWVIFIPIGIINYVSMSKKNMRK